MDNLWSMSIEKLMIWRAGYWSKYDSKTTNWVLRITYDVLIIAANSKVFESLSMHSKIKGFYKGDILILIVSSPAELVRKIKFQIKGDVTQCVKKLNEHFPILNHNSMSRDRVFESRYRNFGEVMIHAVETIGKTTTLSPPKELVDFVKVCLLDPIMPQIIHDTQQIIEELKKSRLLDS